MDTNVGIHIEGERVLIRYLNHFDEPRQKTMAFCTSGGVIEYRQGDRAVTMGKLVDADGRKFIVIPVR